MVHFRKISPKDPPLKHNHSGGIRRFSAHQSNPGLDILRVEAIVYAPARGVAETQMALGPCANSWA